jgi:hypothetical protein
MIYFVNGGRTTEALAYAYLVGLCAMRFMDIADVLPDGLAACAATEEGRDYIGGFSDYAVEVSQ